MRLSRGKGYTAFRGRGRKLRQIPSPRKSHFSAPSSFIDTSHRQVSGPGMSALFDFRSFLTVLLLAICTCTYTKLLSPQARATLRDSFTSAWPVFFALVHVETHLARLRAAVDAENGGSWLVVENGEVCAATALLINDRNLTQHCLEMSPGSGKGCRRMWGSVASPWQCPCCCTSVRNTGAVLRQIQGVLLKLQHTQSFTSASRELSAVPRPIHCRPPGCWCGAPT